MVRIVGQGKIIERLRIWTVTGSAQNALFRGQFGGGKTTIALEYGKMVATEQLYYEICAGQRLYPPTDGAPVVIDEIHRLPNEELWYQYPGILIGCTTEGAPISDPLRSRMVEFWLEPYTTDEMVEIVLLNADLPVWIARVIAMRCRGVPRFAVRLGKEVRAVSSYYSYMPETEAEVGNVLDSLGFYSGGYTDNDRRYLEFVRDRGPVSVRTIALSLNLPLDTVTGEIEPFLLQQNLVTITPKGRSLNVMDNK